jgi:hypothetical protein
LHFELNSKVYARTPSNAFYDWIYIRCLVDHEVFLKKNLEHFDGFTDIEFNPQKSINCQARALAVLVSLSRRGLLHEAAAEYEHFRGLVSRTFAAA